MNQNFQPLHHKYRPQKFNDLIGQDAIASTLKQALITDRIAPAYIFSGPRGTGKTSSARILARSLNCLESKQATPEPCGKCELCKNIALGTALDVIEIDAASNTGVDNIRELIERSKFAPVQARWKVYVIDECHMLSTAAFNALLKTLEEPPKHVVFVLATTDPQRVLPTIISRCQRFEFRRIQLSALEKHLAMIASLEAIDIESEAINLIAQKAQGGLRDAESMLDQLSLLEGPIKIEAVWDVLGTVPEEEILSLASALISSDPIQILEVCNNLINEGREPIAILQGLGSILRDLALLNAAPERTDLSIVSKHLQEKIINISKEVSLQTILKWQAQLKGSEFQLKQTMQPKLWLEILLLGLLAEQNSRENIKVETKINSSAKNKITADLPNNDFNKTNINEKERVKVNNEQKALKEVSANDVSDLWEQILGKLELPSTRMLLSQQAKLVKIYEDKALIKVSSNWVSMVESRRAILEQAIERTVGSSKKIILESQSDNIIPKENNVQKKGAPNVNSGSNSIINDKLKTDKIEIKNKISEPDKQILQQKNDNRQIEPLESEAQKLANFFNGQVLDNDN